MTTLYNTKGITESLTLRVLGENTLGAGPVPAWFAYAQNFLFETLYNEFGQALLKCLANPNRKGPAFSPDRQVDPIVDVILLVEREP